VSAVESRQGGANVRVPPPLVFLAFIGMGVLLHVYVHALPVPLARAARLAAALATGLAGLGLCLSTLQLFVRSGQNPEPWKPTPSLIAVGAYRFSRNPMYLGMLLIQVASGLAFDNLWITLLALPALGAVHHLAVLPEERYLTHKFGESYVAYMASVPRYVGPRR
jgi:protein-S-isoprenylcysteine O-methyltransferase Ste14